MNIPYTFIQFPEIKLLTRDAHKLRGFFGNYFKENSPILHNHYDNGTYRYAYPLVQYKVLKRTPTLVGIGEGANLLVELFLKMKELEIEGKIYTIDTKNIKHRMLELGVQNDLFQYRFETLWMPLNQDNYKEFINQDEELRVSTLNRILKNNILSVLKFEGAEAIQENILVKYNPSEMTNTSFKNQKFLTFGGTFTTNALLPDFIGLGKSVSRGFGTVVQI